VNPCSAVRLVKPPTRSDDSKQRREALSARSSFREAVDAIASELRANAPGHPFLNRAASGIDLLGRRLHGLGFVHDREIANGLTAAIAELRASHLLPQEACAGAVHRAARHLDSALDRMAAAEPAS
jgi:hypothetical protein